MRRPRRVSFSVIRLSDASEVATIAAAAVASISGTAIAGAATISIMKTIAVSTARVDAPNTAAIATSAKARGSTGMPAWAAIDPIQPPKAPPMNSSGASVPPDVPEPSATPPGEELRDAEREQGAADDGAGELGADHGVPNAERTRLDHPDCGEPQCADHRVPELRDRQPTVAPLDHEQALADRDGQQAADQPERDVPEQVEAVRRDERDLRDEGAAVEKPGPDRGRDGGRDEQGHERTCRELEQQQLERQQHRREGGAEDAGGARGGAARKQDPAFGRGHREQLAEQRSDRAARHDDGALRAEGTTAPDRDRRGCRLRDRRPRLDHALPLDDGLHRLRDPVPTDGRQPPRDHAHRQPAGGRDEEQPWPRMQVAHRRWRRRHLLEQRDAR